MMCDSEKLETLIVVSMSINAILSFIILTLNSILLYMLHIKMIAVSAIDNSSIRFQEAIKAADFARMPVVGVLLLSEFVNISYEEVVKEYEKDSMERRAVVYNIFGQNATIKKFIEHYPSQFLRKGYDGEELLLAQNAINTQKTIDVKTHKIAGPPTFLKTHQKSSSLNLHSSARKPM